MQAPVLVGHILCKPLHSGANQNPAAGKGKPIPRMCVDSSQDQLLALPQWKGFSAINLPSSSWLLPLKDGAILGAQPWYLLLAG